MFIPPIIVGPAAPLRLTAGKTIVFPQQVTQPYKLITQKTGVIAGTKEETAAELRRLSVQYSITDFVILSPIKNVEEKRLSYRLLSEAVQPAPQLLLLSRQSHPSFV
jgi:alkanesulfonate monooxygenase SsuD/methylene tetrahydromethanopterin reductase-like flavin-dependent oxidoreductase (luciferase family)